MLAKIATFASKVPAAVLQLAIFITIGVPLLLPKLTGTPLADWATYLGGALALATAYVAYYRQLHPDSETAKSVDRALVASGKSGPAVPPLALLAFVLLLGGCNPTTTQTVIATIPADEQLTVCIANVAETDAGKPLITVILDEVAQCTKDLIPIVNVLDTRVASQLVRGEITLDQANSKLLEIHTACRVAPPKALIWVPKAGASRGGKCGLAPCSVSP